MRQINNLKKETRKYCIPVNGKYYETTKEVYQVYYQMDRRERYLEERDLKKGVVNFTDMGNGYCSVEEVLSDKDMDVEEEVTNKIMIEAVLEAINFLEEEEKILIQELFFNGKSQRELSKECNIPLMTISNRKRKILEKLRKSLSK
jgi:RNA polymerase sigma factor (sigma-70 family)